MTTLLVPVRLHELPKAMLRDLTRLVERITMQTVLEGGGRDLLLHIYLTGVYHGAEVSQIPPGKAPASAKTDPPATRTADDPSTR